MIWYRCAAVNEATIWTIYVPTTIIITSTTLLLQKIIKLCDNFVTYIRTYQKLMCIGDCTVATTSYIRAYRLHPKKETQFSSLPKKPSLCQQTFQCKHFVKKIVAVSGYNYISYAILIRTNGQWVGKLTHSLPDSIQWDMFK